jgi:hypothetical protein
MANQAIPIAISIVFAKRHRAGVTRFAIERAADRPVRCGMERRSSMAAPKRGGNH